MKRRRNESELEEDKVRKSKVFSTVKTVSERQLYANDSGETTWGKWRKQQEKEEEDEKRQTKEEEEEKKIETLEAYERLFLKPPRPILNKQNNNRSLLTEEKKIYNESIPQLGGNFDLTNLIHQYTLADEMGTPREKCYLETRDEKSSCLQNVEKFKKYRGIAIGVIGSIPFDEVECSLYCLLTNLPVSINFFFAHKEPFSLIIRGSSSSGDYHL
jgi:hypothetical protein